MEVVDRNVIAFIGVGIPETLISAAWPAVYKEWLIPESWLSFVTFIIPGCIVLSGTLSSKALNKFGTYKVTFFNILMIALALLGYSLAPSFWWFCVLAVPLGLGAGVINTGINNYVALHYTATHMNFLHNDQAILQNCSELYHKESRRHMSLIYGDFYMLEALLRLEGKDVLFYK